MVDQERDSPDRRVSMKGFIFSIVLMVMVLSVLGISIFEIAGVSWSETAVVTSIGEKMWNSQTNLWNYQITVLTTTHGYAVLNDKTIEPRYMYLLSTLRLNDTIGIWQHPSGIYGISI